MINPVLALMASNLVSFALIRMLACCGTVPLTISILLELWLAKSASVSMDSQVAQLI